MKKEKKTLILLDTHALIHRAFHALPPLTSPKGEPVGAVYGVTTILLKIIRELEPDYIAAAFDRPEPTFRHQAYKEYKAQRKAAPDDLIRQFDAVRELFQAFNIAIYDSPGYEADDVLGTLVRQAQAAEKNIKIIIASGDLDTVQLVEDDDVVVFTMRKGIADTVLYNEKAARERFGFAPELLPDFKGLKGDPSDNIKGVPGVGDKTASILVQKFGSLENVYKALSQKEKYPEVLKGKLPEVLEKHREDAFFSRDLARIHKDTPIVLDIAKTAWAGFTAAKAAQYLKELGFTSLLSRLPLQHTTTDVEHTEHSACSVPYATEDKAAFLQAVRSAGVYAWRTCFETTSPEIECAAQAGVWRFSGDDAKRFSKELRGVFKNDTRHAAFHGKEVLKFLWRAGVDNARITTDVCVAAWLLDSSNRDADLADLLFQNMRKRISADKELLNMENLSDILLKNLKKQKLLSVFKDIEMPLLPVLARMEETGVHIDTEFLKTFSKKLAAAIAVREKKIYKQAGREFTINSPKQLAEVLFDTLLVSASGLKKTKGGARSTRASELIKLRGAHPIVEEILAYREEAKLKSTYVDALPALVHKTTGRVHTTFNQTGTVTGRLSSESPNMQNIPIRTPLGQEIRRAFTAETGYQLISADYSQIELRLAAHLSGDERMIEGFRRGDDIHRITAAAVNHIPESEVTPAMRRAAKAINFGILYGMGAQSLSESLGISHKEASGFIQEYFTQFPRVKELTTALKKQAEEQGYVETLFGRRRYFPDMSSLGWQARREAERMAINAPVQGSGADIIKIAMIRLDTALRNECARGAIRFLLQVHDELLFEVRQELVSDLCVVVKEVMEGVCELAVPLVVDIKHGPNWQELK